MDKRENVQRGCIALRRSTTEKYHRMHTAIVKCFVCKHNVHGACNCAAPFTAPRGELQRAAMLRFWMRAFMIYVPTDRLDDGRRRRRRSTMPDISRARVFPISADERTCRVVC